MTSATPDSFIYRILICFCLAISYIVGAATPGRSQSRPSSNASVERASALVTEGATALKRGDVATARTLLQQALARNENDVGAHTYLGVLADRAGDLAQA